MTDSAAPVSGGVLAAVLTPMKDNFEPDLETLVEHCFWLLDEGCDGLAVLGTTSEANSLSVDERLSILDAVADAGVPADRLIPGVGCCALPDTVRLVRRAVEIGAAGVLQLPPFYYKPVSDDGLFAAYAEVIEHVAAPSLKMYLYHIPQNTGVSITHALIERLVRAYPDTVVGIKDSSGDFDNMTAMLKAFPGFRVFSGSDHFLLPILKAGGAGAITACNNIASRLSADLFVRWKTQEAEALQSRVSAVRAAVPSARLVESLKEIMARRTGRASWRNLRPPLMALGAGEAEAMMTSLEAAGYSLAPEA